MFSLRCLKQKRPCSLSKDVSVIIKGLQYFTVPQECLLLHSVCRRAVEAVGADLTLRQSDSLYYGFQLRELQRVEVKTLRYLSHHSLVFRRISLSILMQALFWYTGILGCVSLGKCGNLSRTTLKIHYHTTRYEFEITL